ncbi:MAG: phosphotransferase family protein [Acidimicrobiia bacterium]
MVESISKTPVTRETAAAIVTDAFGPDAALAGFTECTEGWFNAVHRLDLSDGRSCILKVSPPPEVRVLTYEHDIVTTEVEALRLVRDHTTVPVPAVLWWDDSGRRLPSPLFLMERCEGTLLSELRTAMSEADRARVDAQLAGFLAQLHTLTGPYFGRPDPSAAHADRWSTAFRGLLADLLADGTAAGVDLPVSPAEVLGTVDRHAAALDEVTTPHLVHWDLWDPNVFVDPATATVLGIIDFERVLWADPLLEAQFHARRADDVVTASYGTPLFTTEGAAARRRLYDLYLYLVMTIECAYRHYPTDDVEQMGRGGLALVLAELADAGRDPGARPARRSVQDGYGNAGTTPVRRT